MWPWTPGIFDDWLANRRGAPDSLDLFTTERGYVVGESTTNRRLNRYCKELGLPDGLDFHSFRHS